MTHYDVVIAGGGPAGSTIAALVKKYAPHLKVLVLEKARFPRHHIGESMLAGATPILKESGAYDAVNHHGFVEKLGATYVWGKNREPWGFEFNNIISQLVAQGRALPDTFTKAWQVRRDEYDHILLRHAAEMGAEVKEGAQVHAPIIDKTSGRVTGVKFSDDAGRHTITSTLLMDCTGQNALLGHTFDLRQYDEAMNNYALYGYWKGAKWKVEYVGHPNLTRIFIATTPRGWIWYIPLSHDTISVGFVTHRAVLKDMSVSARSLYLEEVRNCEEINSLVDGAHLVRIAPDQKRDVMTIQDWSYTNRQMVGPGWAMCGDAAGFVDPILSSGAMLAQELGQKAAYTINSMFRAGDDAQIETYWNFYQDTYRTNLQAYRDMAAFWYSNNFSIQSWWWEARRILDADENHLGLNERESFKRIATGYANRAESLSLFGSYPLHEAVQLVDGLFGKTITDVGVMASRYTGRTLRLHPEARLSKGMYFFQGLIRTTQRINAPDKQQYLDLHPGEEMLLRLFDGNHTLEDLNRAADEMRSLQLRMPMRAASELVVQLDEINALA